MVVVSYKERGSEGSTSAPDSLMSGAKPARRTRLQTWVAVFFGLTVAGTGMATPSNASAPTQAQVVAALHITEIDWHKGGFNNIMMLNATVQNTGPRDVKDIQIVCDHLSNSEAKVDSNSGTIYGPFLAGKSKSIHEFDMGFFHDQAKGTNCSIVHATLATKKWRWGRAPR
jgi:hypothetical protein